MFSAALIFEPAHFDAEFHRLNAIIGSTARALSGFLEAETRLSEDDTLKNATYFWDKLESVKVFSTHPAHEEARRRYAPWYSGYHVVISQVVRAHGDSAVAPCVDGRHGTA